MPTSMPRRKRPLPTSPQRPRAAIVCLARLRTAAEVVHRDKPAAAKMFDDIAADGSVGAPERDLARVRAAQLLLETTTYPNMLQRLEPATAKDATFRHTARELLALSAWRANDAAATRQWLDVIANDGETPPCAALACPKRCRHCFRRSLSLSGGSKHHARIEKPDRLLPSSARCPARWLARSTANFDPSDMLDFLDTKKKLPGERKPVFPEGVPGLEQGVPKDLSRGWREQQGDQANPAVAAAPPPGRTAADGREEIEGQVEAGCSAHGAACAPPIPTRLPEEEGSTAAAPPPPKPAKIVRRRTTAPPARSAGPAAAGAAAIAAFPAPLPSGGFQR